MMKYGSADPIVRLSYKRVTFFLLSFNFTDNVYDSIHCANNLFVMSLGAPMLCDTTPSTGFFGCQFDDVPNHVWKRIIIK